MTTSKMYIALLAAAQAPLVLSFQVQHSMAPPHTRQIHTRRLEPLNSAILSEIDSLWQTYPYTAAALVCGFKASAADLVAQVNEVKDQEEEGDESSQSTRLSEAEILQRTASTQALQQQALEEDATFSFLSNADWTRNAAFIAYGVLYQGITQEYFYNHLWPQLFGTDTGVTTVLIKVAFSLLVQAPLLTLPSLYVSKALIEGFSFQEAADQYFYDLRYQGLLQKFCLLWAPVLGLIFTVIPEHLRVTVIAAVSFFWLIVLSSISSNDRDPAQLAAEE
ncbi:Mpv17 / PMP22 family [Seminavis robusta]|uniref:Mpv17 / PMP22 family n=1 Tax=Seminavis robusta TaxID=568900 RepID=A0A9N8H523_9STRA|nr:Mpv17 / PMP22 family [Seminavis robusta]|eukprot:Sro101_g051660.1 Mpv17 / PMP22 family (278) ;mRNA; f:67204-68037